MNDIVILDEDSSLRNEAEIFIKDVYSTHYRANIAPVKSRIIAVLDKTERVLCAAALRAEQDGFFSEAYLHAPIETVLSAASGSGSFAARSSKFRRSPAALRARSRDSSGRSWPSVKRAGSPGPFSR